MRSVRESNEIARRLWAKISIGLGLVASLAIASYLVQDHLVRQDRASAREVDVSGRQRMLSQRTALFAVQASSAAPEARGPLLATHRALVELMAQSHFGLVLFGFWPTLVHVVRNASAGAGDDGLGRSRLSSARGSGASPGPPHPTGRRSSSAGRADRAV